MTDDDTDRSPTGVGSSLPLSRRRALALGGGALGVLALGGTSLTGATQGDDGDGDDSDADNGDGGQRTYRVTVANLTPGQPFTPPAVALHEPSVEVFSVGDPANEAVQALAENGDLDPLVSLIGETDAIRAAAVGESPLVPEDDPGDTGLPFFAELELTADASATQLTFVSMLVATNDGFTGLDTVDLPDEVNESETHYANGYDAGTEQNTELFEDLVPPAKSLIVGGEPEGTTESDPDLAEDGVIRPHPGIEGDGDLDPAVYGWREPAALVQVERIEPEDEPPETTTPGNETTTPTTEEPTTTPGDGEMQTEFQTQLSGEDEVPPVDTDATGQALFELDDDGEELAYELTVQDIEDVVAAHVHCGGPDENGPIGVTLFEGGPISEDGLLAEGTSTGPDSENGCGWSDLADVVAAMRAGEAYVNVHTEEHPAGEIRGQIR